MSNNVGIQYGVAASAMVCSYSLIAFASLQNLYSNQALVKGEQRLVDFKDVVVPMLHKILHDDVEFIGMG